MSSDVKTVYFLPLTWNQMYWFEPCFYELETWCAELWIRDISSKRDYFWCKVSTHVLGHVILRIKVLNFDQNFKMRLYFLISTVFSFALPRSARSVAKNRIGSRFLLTYGLENSRKKTIIPSIQEQYRKFLRSKSIRCREGAKNKFCKMLSTK